MKSLTKQNIYSISLSIFSQPGIKIITSCLFSLYSFLFDPLKTSLYYAIATLIIFDFITAIIASIRSKEKITSAKASRTLVKLFLYGLMVSGATLTDRFVFGYAEIFADLTMTFIAITEFISILENIKKYGFEVPSNVLDKLNFLKKEEIITQIDQTREKLHTVVDKETDKIKETL